MRSRSIALCGVSFRYAGTSVDAIAEVRLEAFAGDVVFLLGRPGSGRTTVLRAVSGMLGREFPGTQDGVIRVDGETRTEYFPARCSSFFDTGHYVTLSMPTVFGEIGQACRNRGVGMEEAKRRTRRALARLEIAHLSDRRIEQLSGGEAKLVSLAATLAPAVSVYALDDPFDELDHTHLLGLIRTLRRVAREGATVLVAAEQLDIAANAGTAYWCFRDNPSTWTRCEEFDYHLDPARISMSSGLAGEVAAEKWRGDERVQTLADIARWSPRR